MNKVLNSYSSEIKIKMKLVLSLMYVQHLK